jgi:hypothetical protein
MDCYPNPGAGLPGRYPTLCELGRKVFVVGDYGKIVLSEDRGESWTLQSNVIWDYKPELQQTFNSLTLNSVFVRAPAGPSPPRSRRRAEFASANSATHRVSVQRI